MNDKVTVSAEEMLDVVIPTDIYAIAPEEVTEATVKTKVNLAEQIKAAREERRKKCGRIMII